MRDTAVSIVATSLLVLLALPAGALAQDAPSDTDWPSYGGDLGNRRYAPLDQIDAANFNELEIAWRFSTASLGPQPEANLQATPLKIGNTLYLTAGSRRAAVALDAATGELLWMHRLDEGERGQVAPRRLSGRGLAYWDDGASGRVLYVTPGYRLIALDAETGQQISSFGTDGIVDLKTDLDQEIDLVTGEIGLHAAPIVADGIIVVGAAHLPGFTPKTIENVKGYVRGFDVMTGERRWIFHTIPQAGEFGNDSWLNDSWKYTGNTGMWAQASVDEELGLVYLPVEMPTNDVYGGHRHGDNLFADSVVALDLQTGERVWHYQTVHHDVWDFDMPSAPMLVDITVDGREIKAVATPTKQSWLFVLDRETGEPVWPIPERPVPASDVPGERLSPTQPHPTKPPAFDQQGVSIDDLIDFTPELRAEAIEIASRHRLGAIYAPPSLSMADGTLGTLITPAVNGRGQLAGRIVRPRHRHALRLLQDAGELVRAHQRSGTVDPGLHPRAAPERRPRDGLAERAGAAVAPTAVGKNHGTRPHRRHARVADRPRRDAGQRQESPGAGWTRDSPDRSAGCHRNAGDEDARHRG